MQVVNYSTARNNLKSIFDSVYTDNEEVIIHRKGGENVVVIPFSEYNSMKESQYLLSNSANRERLLTSLSKVRSGKTFAKDMIDDSAMDG
ncbi:MAG: type II toxin-antitoxin system Phd/YefM family antitoxin [Sulfuricurvum sp.]